MPGSRAASSPFVTSFVLAAAAVGQGSASPYGSGCGSLGGPTLSMQGNPEPGASISLVAGNLVPGTIAVLLAGDSAVTSIYGPLPLALPLPPFGAGCSLSCSANLLFPMSESGTTAALSGALPAAPADYHLYFQVLAVPPAGDWQLSHGLDVHAVAAGTGLADLSGAVALLAGGAPVANCRMTLFTPDLSFFRETRSGADGAYAFSAVPPGSHRLGAAALGLQYQELGVALSPGAQAQSFALGPETEPGAWEVIGNTLPETFDATDIGVLRPDGSVLFCHDTTDPIVFFPATGGKILPPGSASEQGCMNASLLASGAAILCGGQDGADPGSFTKAISWVKLFQPSNFFTQLSDMLAPTGRWYPGLARLADGRLLVMGGGTAPFAERTDTCEVFDPATQTWSWTGSMGSKVEFPPAALLTTGRVLRTWGTQPELYDPATGQWTPTGQFQFPNRGFPGHSDHSLLVFSDGRAAAIGIDTASQPGAAMVEYYDPASGAWTAGASPALRRMQAEVVYLPDGRVLVQGGDKQAQPSAEPSVLGIVKRCDLLEPTSGQWRRLADTLKFREYHAVTLLLPDARVLTTGGTQIKFQVGPSSADVDAFRPPYLFRGVRPQLSNLSNGFPKRGETISFDVFPATLLTGAVLMGMQSTTHWVDGGIPRRLALAVSQSGGQAQLDLPSDPDLLPTGWYLLYGMVDDLPSEAFVLRIDP